MGKGCRETLVGEVQDKGRGGPWTLNVDLYLNPPEASRLELDTVNAQADGAFLQLEHKLGPCANNT